MEELCEASVQDRRIDLGQERDHPVAYSLGPAGDSGSEVQSRLYPLLAFAARNKVALLAVTHRDLRPPPLGRRCTANLAHLAAARVAFHLSADDARPDVRRLHTIKNNLAPAGPALFFRVNAETIEWLGPAPDAAFYQQQDVPRDIGKP